MIDSNLQPYLIAGGKSSRMGIDKRTLVIKGAPLLHHMISLCERATGKIPHLVGNNYDDIAPRHLKIIPDVQPGCGPLGGLVAALEHARTNKSDWILVLAVDLPLLQIKDIHVLMTTYKEAFDCICLTSNYSLQPLAAIYRDSTCKYWINLLDNGELSLVQGLKGLNYQTLLPVSGEHALLNLNTPEELAIIRSVLEEQ